MAVLIVYYEWRIWKKNIIYPQKYLDCRVNGWIIDWIRLFMVWKFPIYRVELLLRKL